MKKSTIAIGALIALVMLVYYAFFVIPEITKVSSRLNQAQQAQNEAAATDTKGEDIDPDPGGESHSAVSTTKDPDPTTETGVGTTEVLIEPDFELAKSVIVGQSCGSCHTLKASGLDLNGQVGPDLSAAGGRGRSDEWLRAQLINPVSIPDEEVVEGFEGMQAVMPSYGALSEEEIVSVIAFLQSLSETTTSVVTTPDISSTSTDTVALAKSVIQSQGCGSCHTLNNQDFSLTGQVGPDLTDIASRGRTKEWLLRQLTDPTSIGDEEVADGFEGLQMVMPSFNRVMSESELQALVEYLFTL